jgi:hypothetical protein
MENFMGSQADGSGQLCACSSRETLVLITISWLVALGWYYALNAMAPSPPHQHRPQPQLSNADLFRRGGTLSRNLDVRQGSWRAQFGHRCPLLAIARSFRLWRGGFFCVKVAIAPE